MNEWEGKDICLLIWFLLSWNASFITFCIICLFIILIFGFLIRFHVYKDRMVLGKYENNMIRKTK